MSGNKRKLFENTLMLYAMQFFNYLFAFLVIPYQTRIMGPGFYGKIGFATAMMVYFQLFIDFGFMLSATADISKKRNNKKDLSRVYTSVTLLKAFLSIISIVILFLIVCFIPEIRKDYNLYFLYLASAIVYAFLPDYLYRGLEIMSEITYRTIFVKCFYTVMIFIFLKKPEQYLLVPIITMLGNLIAVIWANYHVNKQLNIKFCRVTYKELKDTLLSSATFFLSRITTTLYTVTNTVILGIIDTTGQIVGYYTAADKLISTGKSVLSPISDSVYPYMVKNRDFKLIKKILFLFMPIISILCVILFVYADKICMLVFGSEFEASGDLLRLFLPSALITLPLYLFGFPVLGALGLSRHANNSIYIGTFIHVCILIIAYITGNLNVFLLAGLSSFTDYIILSYRLFIVYRYRHLLG